MDTHDLTAEELQQHIAANMETLDKDFDPEYTAALLDNVLSLLQEEYFRSMFVGFEPLPERVRPDTPLIFVSNHSGMSFPWDAMIFLTGMYKLHGRSFEGIPRPLVAPMLARTKLLSPFLMKGLWGRVGCLEANMLNFETLMSQSRYDVKIYPEGERGIGKGFENRYKLQHMSTSFVRMAIKYKTDIISYATVNGEFNNPNSYTSERVDKLVRKLGIPFLPLGGVAPWALLQPWLAYQAHPTKLTYVMGSRFKPYEMTDKVYEEMSQEEFEAIRDEIVAQMQMELDEAVAQYGGSPYKLLDLAQHGWKQLSKIPYLAPSGWPVLFREFDKQYQKDQAKDFKLDTGLLGFWRTARKHPETLPYYIPILGWIPILIQAMMDSDNKNK